MAVTKETDEKRGLLGECSPGDLVLEVQDNVEELDSTHLSSGRLWRYLLRPFQYCTLLLALLFLSSKLLYFNPSATSRQAGLIAQLDFDLPDMPQYRTRTYEKCDSTTASTTHQFEFNITTKGLSAKQWRFLDSSDQETRKNLRGSITIERGTFFQTSDMDIRVGVRSNDVSDLENVLFNTSDSALHMVYRPSDTDDLCTEVQMFVFLRPWPRPLVDRFEIRTNALDVLIQPLLNWEINNLVMHTSYGYVQYDTHAPYTDPLITHNISASSINGTIFGWFVLDENLELRNEHGPLYIFLLPTVYPEGRFDPKSISMSSISGEIGVRTLYDVWPNNDSYTPRTKLESESGKISASIPHGSYTNLSSISGDITAHIQAMSATSPDARSEIYTTTRAGRILFDIRDLPKKYRTGKFNPLANTISKHDAGNGHSWIVYPQGWYGEMEARIELGDFEFVGDSMKDIHWEKGYMTARRGNNGKSQMQTHVGTGALTMFLGYVPNSVRAWYLTGTGNTSSTFSSYDI